MRNVAEAVADASASERTVAVGHDLGVRKIRSSVRSGVFVVVCLNRLPSTGMSPRNGTLVDVRAVALFEDAADHHRAAVLHQHLRLHVLGVDREARPPWPADAVLCSRRTSRDDAAFRRDLRRHVELQVGLAELERGGAAEVATWWAGIRALLDQRLGLVGRDHARLDTTLPRPSASMAEISRFRKRLADERRTATKTRRVAGL